MNEKIKYYKKDIITIAVTIILGIMAVCISGLIYDNGFLKDKLNKNVEYCQAEVTGIITEKMQEDSYIEGIEIGLQKINIKLLDGKMKGQSYTINNSISRLYNTKVKEGSKVIVGVYYGEDGNGVSDISITSLKRSHIIGIMIVLFFAVILLVGGIKGFKSIISLIFTFICIVYVMIPLMMKGVSPVLSSAIIAVICTAVTIILVSGINKKSLCTITGTVAGVLSAGAIAYGFGSWANLSGINMSDAESIMYIAEYTGMKIHGIMFAGILISALGAVMDVAMSICSSIYEIGLINKEMSIRELFNSGMNIGRDIIGTMSNTLILAFAGGSINTLIMLYSAEMSANRLLNLDIIGTEIIQGLAGSIGIILTVPLTAFISAYFCRKELMEK